MKIEHAALYVNDLERAKTFFVTYFHATANDGYYNSTTGFRSYFLTFEGDTRLEIMYHPQMVDCEKQLRRTGYAHLAFSAGSQAAVNSLTARLQADGYTVISGPRTTGDGYYESCIVDLEGNQIEITA